MRDEDDLEPNSLSAEEANFLDVEPEERMDYVDTGQGEEKGEEEEVRFEEEVPGDDVTDEMLLEDVDRADSWLHYNKGLEQTGFAPSEYLTTDTVDTLSREYVLETDAQGMQVNPTIVPGDPPVMYFSGADRFVRAVDARTGDPYWEYRIPWFRPDQQDIYWVLEQGRDRGVAVWGDKVYFGTTDGYIVALDRYTGERQFLGDVRWDEDLPDGMEDYPQIWCGVSAAPVVYDGKVFTGFRTDQVLWSSAQALDAETGEAIWRQPNVTPGGWVEDTWIFGNSTTWMNPTIDPESGLVFFNSGDPSAFFNTLHRPGPNRHSVSTRAFDMETGENVWNHQYLAHEMWDYDACTTPTVTDATVRGEERRVLLETPKDGWMYVLDVETGELLMRSDGFAKQEHRFGDWPESEYLNLVPFGEENAGAMFPPAPGATEWPPDAYSPRTNMRYVGSEDAGQNVYAEGFFLDEVEYGDPDNPFVMGGSESIDDHENVSRVAAIDVDNGEIAWTYEFEDVDPGMPSPWPGGPTVADDVVFGPSAGGDLVALDDETGDELWADDTGGRITAAPVVWDDPDEERAYVAVASNDRVVVYATD